MKSIFNTIAIVSIVVFFGCNEKEALITPEGKDVSIMKKTADVTGTLTNNTGIVNEVFLAVKERIYGEESVLFADLLDEESSSLKSTKTSQFRSKFISALKDGDNLKSSGVDDYNELIELLENGKIQIYWPYHENWDGKTMPTITYNDGIHKVENFGYKPDGSKVLVNEDYAMVNPVWIINTLEFEGDLAQLRSWVQDEQKRLKSATDAKGTKEYLAVKMAKINCTDQRDPFYDGGPEIRIIRAGLVDEWHANISDWQMSKNFTRSEVRNGTWLDFNNSWDTRWGANKELQVIGCYDYDGMGDWKVWISGQIKGSYTYKKDGVDVTVSTDMGFNKNYDGDETAIYKNSWGSQEWARTALANENIESLGCVNIKWTNFSYFETTN